MRLALAALLSALLAPAALSEPPVAAVRRSFQDPPDDSRILMRWWWFGPAVTKPELEREMRVMKDGGIGGFEVQSVYPVALDDAATGIKNVPFLSDEFIEALRFASLKGRELGLRVDLTLGSGWPYGGPQVSIGQAAGRLRVERVKVAEGVRRVPSPDIGAGEKWIGAFLARSDGESLVAGSVREITDVADGVVRLPAGLTGPHELLLFVSSRTGMMVKRPALGAEGFVLDHYDRGALERYLESVGDRLMQAFGPHPPYAIFCDSLEVYGSDWTADLLEEFQKRRGYDLRPHLPALVTDKGPEAAGVRHDWGMTLTELLNERFLGPMREWSRRNGTRFRLQGYGIPPATLSSNSLADLPEGEGHQWKALRASRWASSASHLYGNPVTSSETWTWLHSPSFRATPLDVKAEADLHFLQGINQLIGHGWPYSAEGAPYPGWRFYAAGVFNEKNPWWIVMPDLSRYLQRLSFLLRQGQPANDVAVYLPNHDAWARFTPGRVQMIETLGEVLGPDIVARVLEAGFNLDFFDDEALARVGRIEKGSLVLGTNRYRAVVLPGVESIPLPTYRKLEEFARAGGAVIATRRLPTTAPGLLASPGEQIELRAISRRLFQASSPAARFLEDESRVPDTLKALLRPDVALLPAAPEIGFVHRTTGDSEIYFLANTSNTRQGVTATFRVKGGLRAEWWDPMTGRVLPARAHPRAGGGGQTVSLELEAYGSRVLVFSEGASGPEPGRASAPALGRSTPPRVEALPAPIDLSRGWRVSFGPDRPPVRMDRLGSWTEDEGTRTFSGVATYVKDVDVPEDFFRAGLALRLDLGEAQPIPPLAGARQQAWLQAPVLEAAVVYVNDRRAGSVWCPPYSVDVTGWLRAGANTLRIEVANLAINRMAGRALPDYRLLNLRYGTRFEPQDMDKVQRVPAGLLGPIRIVATGF